MVKQDILLNMRGKYCADEPNPHSLELYVEGTLIKKDGAHIIEYVSNAELGNPQILKLTVKDEEIRMQCTGDIETDFLFTKNQCFLTAFPTPEGLIEVTIFPHEVVSRINSESGTIDLGYTIRMGDKSSYNKLSIDYRLKN